jgi:hypothetical protein
LFPLDDIPGARSHRTAIPSIAKLKFNCIPARLRLLSLLTTREAALFDKPKPIAYNTMQP